MRHMKNALTVLFAVVLSLAPRTGEAQRGPQGHALAGKTCHAAWQVESGSSCANCYGSVKIVFDRNGGAMSGVVNGFSAYNNPASASYTLAPVTDLANDGNVYTFRSSAGARYRLDVATKQGNIDPRPKLPQGANMKNLECR